MKFKLFHLIFALFFLGLSFCIYNYSCQIIVSPTNSNSIEVYQEEYNSKENPQARRDYEFKMLKDPATGEIPSGIHHRSIRIAQKTSEFKLKEHAGQKSIPTIIVTSKGPNNYGGRTRALAFDVRNSQIVIAGGVSGGIFRSTNNGEDWTRVTPAGILHNMTAIAQDTRSGHQDTWYVGTGERLGNSAGGGGATYLGYGIWKSINNGLTWSSLSSTQNGAQQNWDNDFDYVSKILVSPTNGDVFVMGGEVLKRSTDGGTSWLNELGDSGTDNGKPGDIVYNINSSKYYVAIDGTASTSAGVWSSSDGDNWLQLRTPNQLNANGVKRIVLSNVAYTSEVLVMCQLSTSHNCGGATSEVGLYHFDGTSTWTDHTGNISDCASGSTSPKSISLQGGYNMCITTKPNDPNFVYLGGVEVFRYNLSTNEYVFIGGSQLAASTTNLHVDNHILIFEDNNTLWAGNDGGIRNANVIGTLNGDGFIWNSKNKNYVTYQYYDADIHPSIGSAFLAGAAQDNAFTIQPTSAQALEVGPTVDGTAVGVISGSSFSTYAIIAAFQNGGLTHIENGTEKDIEPTGKTQGFNTKIHLDDDNRKILYYPDSSPGLLRTRDANQVSNSISNNADLNWENLPGVVSGDQISAMATSRNVQFGGAYTSSDSNRKLYFGTESGDVFRLNDPAFGSANNAAINITPSGSSGFVSDLAVNPMDDKEVIVSYSNYGVVSVWHTNDASVSNPSWTNVEGAENTVVQISSARSVSIVNTNGSKVYLVGTSAGLYGTDDLSVAVPVWTMVGANTSLDIGMAVCSEMRHRTTDNNMALGTHGNGLFLIEFPTILPIDLSSFEGEATIKGNRLNWTTLSEVNNKGFEIQRSLNGNNFEEIGFLDGAGNTSGQQSYELLDTEIEEGIRYYRLKQIDLNGAFTYSEIIKIYRESQADIEFSIYPNPVVNTLTIKNGMGIASIYAVSGQKMLTINLRNNNEEIDVTGLPKGMYVISLETENTGVVTKSFVK